MSNRTFDVYEVTGNTNAKRIGRLFPTGWTKLATDDGTFRIATEHRFPYSLRGTKYTKVGTIGFLDMVARQA